MVIAFAHGVVIAQLAVTEAASCDYSLLCEPSPGRANLTAIAAHGLALQEVAAACGVGD
jgi:hypothetical protein